MSGSIGSVGTGYGFLNTLTTEASALHQQLNTLSEQVSSGLVAQTYAGLGSSAAVSLDLNPQLTALQTYQNNISQATGTMQVTQTAMTQLQQIAAKFASDMPNLTSTNTQEITSIAQQAQAALTQVAGLLDTRDGDVYVFGGQDTSNPPVSQPDAILTTTGGFYSQINAAVNGLATDDANATNTITATFNTAASNSAGTSPFSTYQSGGNGPIAQQVVQTGQGQSVSIGLLASANSYVVSTGTSVANATATSLPTTTGSYMRDLMCALATIGSMTSSSASAAGFVALVQNTTTSLNGAVSAMDGDIGALGNTQSTLTTTQTQLSDTATALTGQVSAVQDVDMASTLSNLTAIQTQLEASYRMIATEGTLSLANYLPA
jgi:flagellar hook-associated protein 3 FlgL